MQLIEKDKAVDHSTILSYGSVSKLFSYFRYVLELLPSLDDNISFTISKMTCALN